MEDKKIIIIGDSPATYICGIYLHTANINLTILKKDLNLQYSCTFVPGVEAKKDEYNKKCHDQAKNMGIEIIDCDELNALESNGKYTIKYDNSVFEADIVVADKSLGLKLSDNYFVVDDLLLEREAIVVAGVGCTIAFEIKELMH